MLRPTRSLSVFTTVLLSTTTAEACGGFFCSFAPMNQDSERILFVDRDDSVTAHVQIAYTGEAADFAWTLPVPSQAVTGGQSQRTVQPVTVCHAVHVPPRMARRC
ncbi:MAG: DUF2330 domain-containing protein [Candidatus Latescibacterota bacterium]